MIVEALQSRQVFADIAALDEALFPLDKAALAIGMEEYPGLNIEEYLRHLNGLAARAEALIGQDRSAYNILQCLNEALFVQEGLHGNLEDYYNPKNSFLNEVLDNKEGIPISLSVIYIEVARRINFAVQGVGLPGHFIVKHVHGGEEVFVDPFNQGRILTMKDCQELLDNIYGGSVSIQPTFLQAMEKKAIISRMLFNLKGIYYQKEEHSKALSIVERILILNPGTLSEIRDRGMLYMHTSLFSKALADLEYYMKHVHAPEEATQMERHIKTLRNIVSAPN